MQTEHRINVLALWGNDRHPELTRKCRVLDYGPVQGSRMIRLTDAPKRRPGYIAIEYAKGSTICADLDDVKQRG